MSHLEHIFVSINGPWTGKIIPPVPLPISLVKVEEHNILFWDEKGRQRDGNIKGSMSPAGTDPVGTRASSKLCLGLTTRGNLGISFAHHFPFSHWFSWIPGWFYQERIYEGELGPVAEFSCSPGGWNQSGCLCCEQLSVRKHQLTSSTKDLKSLLNPPPTMITKMTHQQQNNGITRCQTLARWPTEIKYFMSLEKNNN